MGIFERCLTLWVTAAIASGIALGTLLPGVFSVLADLEVARVNLIVAALIWVMIYPMLVNVDLASLRQIGVRPKGLVLTIVVNWLVKLFTMAGLGLLFFEVFFRSWVNPVDAREYVAGMILLGSAPCTAMVFVWSQLARGDATYTHVQAFASWLSILSSTQVPTNRSLTLVDQVSAGKVARAIATTAVFLMDHLVRPLTPGVEPLDS